MFRTKSRALSSEEEAELERSNKKVKDVRHAGFSASQDGNLQPQGRLNSPSHGEKSSFRDKLLGEIPGAYNQAFAFEEHMEADIESDEELEELREGFAAVKLSKDVKHRIRAVWASSLIVKVYGRSVGFSYIQNKLNALWKPNGRLDVIDLGKDFFLTRFSCKEDHDKVLRNGPWFIGEHFLSIRPWEPNFKPSTTNVSSIAVWIRLNELPIEYYEVEVLKQIGNSVGKVLRIDTHTAAEARGRFARLCIQVDLDKPLVTNILIGGIYQPVNYEGIHRLCFSCGRIGHRKEACPYTIRSTPMPDTVNGDSVDGQVSSSHVGCDLGDPTTGEAPRSPEQEDAYGPWVVVTKKRQGNRGVRNTPEGSGVGYLRVSGGTAYLRVGSKSSNMEFNKRKAGEAIPEGRVQEPKATAFKENEGNEMGHSNEPTGLTDAGNLGHFNNGPATTQAQHPSVKGKKDFARNRAHIQSVRAATSSTNIPEVLSFTSIPKPSYGTSSRDDSSFLFTATASVDTQSLGAASSSQEDATAKERSTLGNGSNPIVGNSVQGAAAGGVLPSYLEDLGGKVIGEEVVGVPNENHTQKAPRTGDSSHGEVTQSLPNQQVGDEDIQVLPDSFCGERSIDGTVEVDGMELEGGGNSLPSC